MLFPRRKISDHAWKPGQLAEVSVHSDTRSYPIGMSGMSCDYSLIRFSPVGNPPAVPSPEWCGADCADGVGDIVITVHYPDCCLDGVKINVPYPAEGETLGENLLCHIRDSRIAGLGAFGWDEENNTLNFRGRFPNFPVDFSVTTDPAVYDVCVEAKPKDPYAGRRDRVIAGTAVVVAPMRQTGNEIEAFVPSQDVNAPDATECWLGVAIRTDNAGEKAPVINATWPAFNGCDEHCEPESTCISIAAPGEPVFIELEQAHQPQYGCKLYYRYQPDAENGFTEPGFSPVPGPGLAEVPVRTLFLGSKGNISKIQFG